MSDKVFVVIGGPYGSGPRTAVFSSRERAAAFSKMEIDSTLVDAVVDEFANEVDGPPVWGVILYENGNIYVKQDTSCLTIQYDKNCVVQPVTPEGEKFYIRAPTATKALIEAMDRACVRRMAETLAEEMDPANSFYEMVKR